MNKAERHRIKMKKYLRRLRNLGLINCKGNFFHYRSHGKPCSCNLCRNKKYRNQRAKEKINVLNDEIRKDEDKIKFTILTKEQVEADRSSANDYLL